MSGKRSNNKGKRWEREVAAMIREAMPGADIRRGWQDRAGSDEPDVICPVYWVEAKHHKLTNPRAALRQATSDASPGRVPIAVCKDDRQPAHVTMWLDDWLEMVRQWWIETR